MYLLFAYTAIEYTTAFDVGEVSIIQLHCILISRSIDLCDCLHLYRFTTRTGRVHQDQSQSGGKEEK